MVYIKEVVVLRNTGYIEGLGFSWRGMSVGGRKIWARETNRVIVGDTRVRARDAKAFCASLWRPSVTEAFSM